MNIRNSNYTKYHTISFRVTASEKEEMVRKSQEVGLDLSTYLRCQALKVGPLFGYSRGGLSEVSIYDKYNVYLSANILMLLHSVAENLNIDDEILAAEEKALKWLHDKKLLQGKVKT